jgi:hypothetical protein
MSCQVKHWIYINDVKVETVKVKYVETKKPEQHVQPVQWLRWFFMKRVTRPVEVWEDAFPWP